jgi:para-nitrobenzyl esterase
VAGLWSDGVATFAGIPYAAPPVGPRRYCPPAQPAAWHGIRDCRVPGPACPQVPVTTPRYAVPGARAEDCLTLNVWTPEPGGDLRPVVVFVHGGGYWAGSGNVSVYDGSAFARAGVVCVTLNYRLATFGFLYLDELFDTLSGTGNLGVLDVIRALEWIQTNIAAFGGDPGRVLLTGSSAGGITASTVPAMSAAAGLVRRIAPVSCAPGHTQDRASATALAHAVLDHVGVAPGDLQALLALPAERLVPDEVLIGKLLAEGLPIGFGPVVDGSTLPRAPLDALADGEARDVDLLIGCTTDEFGGRHTTTLSAVDALAIDDIPLPRPTPEQADLTRLLGPEAPVTEITHAYARDLRAAGRPAEDLDVYLAAHSDVRMVVPTLRYAATQARHNRSTYVFRFSWPSPGYDGALGAFHGLATPFSFGNLRDPAWRDVLGPEPPERLSTELQGALIAFAADGDPNHAALPRWPTFACPERPTMDFGPTTRLLVDPDHERLRLLNRPGSPRDRQSGIPESRIT